jgi:hypothetical protein
MQRAEDDCTTGAVVDKRLPTKEECEKAEAEAAKVRTETTENFMMKTLQSGKKRKK